MFVFSDTDTVMVALPSPDDGDTVHQLGAVIVQFVLLLMVKVCKPLMLSKLRLVLLAVMVYYEGQGTH